MTTLSRDLGQTNTAACLEPVGSRTKSPDLRKPFAKLTVPESRSYNHALPRSPNRLTFSVKGQQCKLPLELPTSRLVAPSNNNELTAFFSLLSTTEWIIGTHSGAELYGFWVERREGEAGKPLEEDGLDLLGAVGGKSHEFGEACI
jgi:hypothetical protein